MKNSRKRLRLSGVLSCWFHLKLEVGIYMLPISCKYEIWLSKLTRIFGCLLVSRKGGDILYDESFVSLHLSLSVSTLFLRVFSKLFEASPGLWKNAAPGRGEKRPADRKKHGRNGGFRDWYQEGELDSQACGGLGLSAISVLRIPNCCNVDLNIEILCCKGFILLVRKAG